MAGRRRGVKEAVYSLQMNGDVVRPVMYSNEADAARMRDGIVQGAVIFATRFSPRRAIA